MKKAMFPPVDVINLGGLQESIQKLSRASGARNYQQAISHANTAIDQTLHLQLLDLLDNRAYSYAMHGQFELAIVDTQRMIGYSPREATGYLRKGRVLSLYGYQVRAVEAYDEGIINANRNSRQFEEIKAARESASSLNTKCIDIITATPIEIANEILSRLPQTTIIVCLNISDAWEKRVLGCEPAWRVLSICDYPTSFQVSNMMASIVQHVQHLKISNGSINARDASFEYMKKGLFSNIQSLKMSALATQDLQLQFATISVALWETRITLTSIDIDFSNSRNPITLASLLRACCSVTKLRYTGSSAMKNLAGDFSTSKNDRALIDLHLKASTITGPDIENLLQHCQQLRKLTMNGCDTTVLKPINTHASNLEILGYNWYFNKDIELCRKTGRVQGLQELYIPPAIYPAILASDILPLLYKNMTTLRLIYGNVSSSPDINFPQFRTTYAGFQLSKLYLLNITLTMETQELLLQAIIHSKTLTHFYVTGLHDLQAVINAILKLPVLTNLGISNMIYTGISAADVTTAMTRLFDSYTKKRVEVLKPLQSILLQNFEEVTNAIFDSLAGITSLREISLRGLKKVTATGLDTLLRQIGQQLTSVTLVELDTVVDTHIAFLGECKYLKQVKLSKLPSITDQGIQNMLSGAGCALDMLAVEKCPKITDDCMHYAKVQNLKMTVSFTPT